MHCFTSCWRLVDRLEDSLNLAIRVSSILLELCKLEGRLLLLGATQENIPHAVAEAALAIALEGISDEWL